MKLTILALSLVLAGCATKNAGRMSPISEVERNTLTCREIHVEQVKVSGFFDGIKKEFQPDYRDVMAFLGDFGIGNHMEKTAGMESAQTRMAQLIEAYDARGCNGGS